MLKRFMVALAAAALLMGGLGVGSASADPVQAQAFSSGSCSSGGTTTNITVFYTHNNPPSQGIRISNWAWSTSPATALNRIALEALSNGENYSPISAAGGAFSTLNDVPSSESGYANGLPGDLGGSNPRWRAKVYGGVGNSTAECFTAYVSMP